MAWIYRYILIIGGFLVNRCDKCNVSVDENLKRCPLCQKSITDIDRKDENLLYPKYKVDKQKGRLVFKYFLFMSIALASTTIFINLLTLKFYHELWFLYIVLAILYSWLLVRNTILSKMHTGAKILFQLFGISSILYIVDVNTGFNNWSVNYVLPFLLIGTTLLITIIVYTKKLLWSQYIGYAITAIFIGFIPIILYGLRVIDVFIPSAVSALYSILTLILMFVFSNKKFKDEFVRRFHIK